MAAAAGDGVVAGAAPAGVDTGTAAIGADASGADDTGADDTGADDTGADDTGADAPNAACVTTVVGVATTDGTVDRAASAVAVERFAESFVANTLALLAAIGVEAVFDVPASSRPAVALVAALIGAGFDNAGAVAGTSASPVAGRANSVTPSATGDALPFRKRKEGS